jgi:RNA polymerase sigma-70 factor, ECF subfamily
VDRKREQGLIQLAQRGDSQAFAELYNAYVDNIYRYIFYRVNVAAVAEDLTADVFMHALEGLPNYQDRSVSLLAWLYRIAHARLVDYYRRTERAGPHENIDEIELGFEEDLDSPIMTLHQTDHIQAALRTLTGEQQQVIILRFMEGHSLEKTAELLGKTTGAIKSMQLRALNALSRALERQGFKPQDR